MKTISCREAQQQLANIRMHARQLAIACPSLNQTPELRYTARQIKQQLVTSVETLEDALNPFEHALKLKEQYEFQRNLLESHGLIETLSTGEQGIIGINDHEYPIPTYREITRRMRENRETLATKIKQGFVKLILVPFGVPLSRLTDAYRTALQQHFDDKQLFHTQKTRTHEHEPIEESEPITELNIYGPLLIWDEFNNADRNGTLIYYPTEFSKNHGGKTKHEYLTHRCGWNILLLEDMPNIPRTPDDAMTTETRTQIGTSGRTISRYITKGETIPSADEYLNAITSESQNPQSPYYAECGITPEDQIMYAMTHLTATNQVIDDAFAGGHGSVSWQIGSYLPTSSNVPIAYWNRGNHRTYLYRIHSGNRYEYDGVRSAVRV